MPLSEMRMERLEALSHACGDPTDPTAVPVYIEGYGTRARELTLDGCVLDVRSRLPEGHIYHLSFCVTPMCCFNLSAAAVTSARDLAAGRRVQRMRFLRQTPDQADAVAMLVYRFGTMEFEDAPQQIACDARR